MEYSRRSFMEAARKTAAAYAAIIRTVAETGKVLRVEAEIA
jgi:hypothetical protein